MSDMLYLQDVIKEQNKSLEAYDKQDNAELFNESNRNLANTIALWNMTVRNLDSMPGDIDQTSMDLINNSRTLSGFYEKFSGLDKVSQTNYAGVIADMEVANQYKDFQSMAKTAMGQEIRNQKREQITNLVNNIRSYDKEKHTSLIKDNADHAYIYELTASPDTVEVQKTINMVKSVQKTQDDWVKSMAEASELQQERFKSTRLEKFEVDTDILWMTADAMAFVASAGTGALITAAGKGVGKRLLQQGVKDYFKKGAMRRATTAHIAGEGLAEASIQYAMNAEDIPEWSRWTVGVGGFLVGNFAVAPTVYNRLTNVAASVRTSEKLVDFKNGVSEFIRADGGLGYLQTFTERSMITAYRKHGRDVYLTPLTKVKSRLAEVYEDGMEDITSLLGRGLDDAVEATVDSAGKITILKESDRKIVASLLKSEPDAHIPLKFVDDLGNTIGPKVAKKMGARSIHNQVKKLKDELQLPIGQYRNVTTEIVEASRKVNNMEVEDNLKRAVAGILLDAVSKGQDATQTAVKLLDGDLDIASGLSEASFLTSHVLPVMDNLASDADDVKELAMIGLLAGAGKKRVATDIVSASMLKTLESQSMFNDAVNGYINQQIQYESMLKYHNIKNAEDVKEYLATFKQHALELEDKSNSIIDNTDFESAFDSIESGFLKRVTNLIDKGIGRTVFQRQPSYLKDLGAGVSAKAKKLFNTAIKDLTDYEKKQVNKLAMAVNIDKKKYTKELITTEYGKRIADAVENLTGITDAMYEVMEGMAKKQIQKNGIFELSRSIEGIGEAKDQVKYIGKSKKEPGKIRVQSTRGKTYLLDEDAIQPVTQALSKEDFYLPIIAKGEYDMYWKVGDKYRYIGAHSKASARKLQADLQESVRKSGKGEKVTVEIVNKGGNPRGEKVWFRNSKKQKELFDEEGDFFREMLNRGYSRDDISRIISAPEKDVKKFSLNLTGRAIDRANIARYSEYMDIEESLNSLSNTFGKLVSLQEYHTEIGTRFLKKFGHLLEKSPDGVKRWDNVIIKTSDTGTAAEIEQARLVQNQLRNYMNVKTRDVQVLEDSLLKWGAKLNAPGNLGATRQVGKLLDRVNVGWTVDKMRSLGSSMKLGMQLFQIPLQFSHSAITMFAHPVEALKAVTDFAEYMTLKGILKLDKSMINNIPKSSLSRFFEIEGSGVMNNFLPNELEMMSGPKWLRTAHQFSMFPVKAGEFANRAFGSLTAMRVAEGKGLIAGTSEYRKFVNEYGKTLALDMSNITEPSLSKGIAGATFGQFKRYYTQTLDLIFHELNPAQRLQTIAGLYALYGKEGIPLGADGALIAEYAKDKLEFMFHITMADAVSDKSVDWRKYFDEQYNKPAIDSVEVDDNGEFGFKSLMKAMYEHKGIFNDVKSRTAFGSPIVDLYENGLMGLLGPALSSLDKGSEEFINSALVSVALTHDQQMELWGNTARTILKSTYVGVSNHLEAFLKVTDMLQVENTEKYLEELQKDKSEFDMDVVNTKVKLQELKSWRSTKGKLLTESVQIGDVVAVISGLGMVDDKEAKKMIVRQRRRINALKELTRVYGERAGQYMLANKYDLADQINSALGYTISNMSDNEELSQLLMKNFSSTVGRTYRFGKESSVDILNNNPLYNNYNQIRGGNTQGKKVLDIIELRNDIEKEVAK